MRADGPLPIRSRRGFDVSFGPEILFRVLPAVIADGSVVRRFGDDEEIDELSQPVVSRCHAIPFYSVQERFDVQRQVVISETGGLYVD